MAASRLSDSQKSELVARYRFGEGSAELALAYGCSANTISRTVKAALPAEEYERLKQDRARGLKPPLASVEAKAVPAEKAVPGDTEVPAETAGPAQADPAPLAAQSPMVAADIQASQVEMELPPAVGRQWQEQVVELASDELAIGELAIDDADDFAAIEPAMELSSGAAFADGDGNGEDENDASEDGDDQVDGDVAEIDEAADEIDEDEIDEDELDEGELDEADVDEDELFLAVAPLEQRLQPVSCQPLRDAPLPASVYMLVDKTVELEVRPLKEFPELGLLPPDEEERQALQVFVNPRQAKRHCGRSQRVIKIPDTRIFERTASHLLAQGISRVVIENSLYSLPGA
jgi:hypothetical protein